MNISLNVKVIFVLNHLLYSQLFSQSLSDSLIGVHCVHGVNRTGYMICRYLIEKRGWNPQNAIDAFENARGEKMEKNGKYHKCIQDLLNRKSLSALWLVQCAYYCFLVGKYIPKFLSWPLVVIHLVVFSLLSFFHAISRSWFCLVGSLLIME